MGLLSIIMFKHINIICSLYKKALSEVSVYTYGIFTKSPVIVHCDYWRMCYVQVSSKTQCTQPQCILIIPLSHYSRNAPRIHNVGHIFQIAKVPSGVCKIRPAFLLDSATFLAIANARGNVQVGSCVSGRYFIFSKIREFIKNPIQQTYERTNTIRWSKNPTGH